MWFPRSQLNSKCHGFDKAIISQANTPVGSKLVYDGEKKRTLQVTPEIFSTFAKVWWSFMNVTTKSAACLIASQMFACSESYVSHLDFFIHKTRQHSLFLDSLNWRLSVLLTSSHFSHLVLISKHILVTHVSFLCK